MAVYTEVPDGELAQFIAEYDIGDPVSCKGIAEGVENSNFLLRTTGPGSESGTYILTLYEKRVRADDLPFFIGLMQHLAAKGLSCPTPIADRKGEALKTLCGRPAALISFLEGMWPRRPAEKHCQALGAALADFHLKGRDFAMRRPNDLSVEGWRKLIAGTANRADEVEPGLGAKLEAEFAYLEAHWPTDLASGVIHADLFPDNVFFLGDRLSGIIDFYFACTDFLAYDLAVCLNAWCFQPDFSFNVTKAKLMFDSYRKLRPIPDAEMQAIPLLARGAALRFLLTRLYDWLNHPPGAFVKPKDPTEYIRKLRFHQAARDIGAYGLRSGEAKATVVDIFTDGACSGNPGPGGWGALLRYGEVEKEISGGETLTTNNRMELMAAIAALEALKRPATVRVHTDSQYVRNGITEWVPQWKKRGWRTADKKPVKNSDLWQRLEKAEQPHKVEWLWVKGHNGHIENERADQLARLAIPAKAIG